MKQLLDYVKTHVLGSLAVFIATAACVGIWSLVALVWDLPDKVAKDMEEDARRDREMTDYRASVQKTIDELRESDKSLNRRITNNQTEIFYLLMNKPKPSPQNQ